MKPTLKHTDRAVVYTLGLAAYGKYLPTGRYKIEVHLPGMPELNLTLYRSKSKPLFRNLFLINLLWAPFTLLAYLLCALLIIVVILTSFYITCLFKKSFISGWIDTTSGYISLFFSIVGIVSTILFIIHLL